MSPDKGKFHHLAQFQVFGFLKCLIRFWQLLFLNLCWYFFAKDQNYVAVNG